MAESYHHFSFFTAVGTPKVIIMTASGATGGKGFDIVTAHGFLWRIYRLVK